MTTEGIEEVREIAQEIDLLIGIAREVYETAIENVIAIEIENVKESASVIEIVNGNVKENVRENVKGIAIASVGLKLEKRKTIEIMLRLKTKRKRMSEDG